MLKQLFSIKINGIKNTLFFLSGAPTHDSFTFNLRFLYVLKHKCWIFHFGFRFVFIKVYILFNKVNKLFYFKSSLFFSKLNNRKVAHSFTSRPLIFKQQEVWKIDDICVSWSLPKTDQVTDFLNLENRSFWKCQFFSIVTFKKIFGIPLLTTSLFLLLTYLFL